MEHLITNCLDKGRSYLTVLPSGTELHTGNTKKVNGSTIAKRSQDGIYSQQQKPTRQSQELGTDLHRLPYFHSFFPSLLSAQHLECFFVFSC